MSKKIGQLVNQVQKGDLSEQSISAKRSLTQPIEPVQSDTATLLEWWWGPMQHIEWWWDSVLSAKKSPMQSHTAHAAIHAAPNTIPYSPTQSLYLKGGGDLCSHPCSPQAVTLLEWWWVPMQPSMQPQAATLLVWWFRSIQPI